ncbi:hypothetical protein [Treponema pectinovorum]|uniref:hypothetical protein n=1 Tax=Treponema pectinovorum TaxID=164 RepID=UPI0011F35EA0|nr:hypothetical protein [Treponema pectinovorum]
MWEELRLENKLEYKKMILAFASLTKMFAQKTDEEEDDKTLSPIINSKYQETVFQKVFKASSEDIGNTSYDAAILLKKDDGAEIKYLIGIKTFGYYAGAQKIAQFKANITDWSDIITKIQANSKDKTDKAEINTLNNKLYKELAINIATLRNLRIESSKANIHGFKVNEQETENIESVYHVLMPSKKGENPSIYVGETQYDKIDIDNIQILGCSNHKNPCNFTFTDGHHEYRYTIADSQLLMDFKNQEIIKENWTVKYAEDAYKIFENIANQVYKEDEIKIVESYCWELKIEKYSGLNNFYGTGSKLGVDTRKSRINKICETYGNIIDSDKLTKIRQLLEIYLLKNSTNDNERAEKVEIRENIIKIIKEVNKQQLTTDIYKLLFRPVDEVYIPLPNSSNFHTKTPDFFAPNVAQLKEDGKSLAKPKEERKFTLVFEPSGKEIDCYITQEAGKAIESFEKQSYLGNWILKGIFQLKDYEPLTDKKLRDVGINGYRLYKTNKDNKVHFQFIWIDSSNKPVDLWEN